MKWSPPARSRIWILANLMTSWWGGVVCGFRRDIRWTRVEHSTQHSLDLTHDGRDPVRSRRGTFFVYRRIVWFGAWFHPGPFCKGYAAYRSYIVTSCHLALSPNQISSCQQVSDLRGISWILTDHISSMCCTYLVSLDNNHDAVGVYARVTVQSS